MTNQQAYEMVLTWCRSSAAQRNGRVPVMREYNGIHCVIDASFIDWTADGATLASGADWIEVCAELGVYGPQWKPAPVGPCTYAYHGRSCLCSNHMGKNRGRRL